MRSFPFLPSPPFPARLPPALPPPPAAVAAALLLAVGCGGAPDSERDPFGAAAWRVEGPELRIGSLDDPGYIFGSVAAMAMGPQGRLYSLHRSEEAVRRWNADGTPAGSIGRGGEGPGEFTRPSDIGFFGDSLWVWDDWVYRLSYFDLDGAFLGSLSPRIELGTGGTGSPPRPDRPLRDGSFVGVAPMGSEEIAKGALTEIPYVRMNAEGQPSTPIWTRPVEMHDALAIASGPYTLFLSQPFGDDHLVLTTGTGILVANRRVRTGEGAAAVRVTRIGLDGDTVFSATAPYEPEPLGAARVDSVVAGLASQLERAFDGEGVREPEIRAALFRPDHLPAVKALVEAADGAIWLERFDPVVNEAGAALTEWWVLDAAGAPLGRAWTPAGLDVRLIGDDELWGVESDEMDVQYIVRYRLVRDGDEE